jgi:hypothetical protein
MTLSEQVKTISSHEDFVAFVKALSKDLHDNPATWENTDLESFLEALAAWIEDTFEYYTSQGIPVPKQPDWKLAAVMLLGAKIYE